jgi:hypothetical protein
MGTDVAERIAKHKASKSPALTRKEKQANREAVKELAAKHMEAAIKKLSEIVTDKNAPASAKVAAATQLLDRVAGKPKFADERETEQSQLDRMPGVELLQYICDNISGLSTQARAAIAQSLLAAEKGFSVDVRDIVDEDFSESAALRAENEPEGLPPLTSEPKKKKEPRR